MTEIDKNTEQKILDAARKVFTRQGFAAARMDDIAQEAGINRALLHYYFRSKQKLFDVIFAENMGNFYSSFVSILGSDADLEPKSGALCMLKSICYLKIRISPYLSSVKQAVIRK
jgi:TetR/AcrR family transcriptional regulator